MKMIDAQLAQDKLPELLEQVSVGENIIISRGGQPLARLTAFTNVQWVGRKFSGGNLRLQEQASRPQRPEYLKQVAASKYDD